MLNLQLSNGKLIQSASELPSLAAAKTVYADLETSSGDPKKESFNPWHNCRIAGMAVTVDECPDIWYIPREHLSQQWISDTFSPEKLWVNHNIKYDANVLFADTGFMFRGRMFDTMTGAKLIDSDRWTYSLDALTRDWLKIQPKAKHLLAPYLVGNKDYGRIPPEILGDYACHDVTLARELSRTIIRYMPPESQGVFETEQSLTTILFEAETLGLKLLPYADLEKEQAKVLYELLQIVHPKLVELSGFDGFEPHKSSDCHAVFHEKFGLPILELTDNDEPSYGKHVLHQYLAIPDAPHDLINQALRWKELWQYNNLFLETYLALGVEDTIHPSFNQCIRTGRMSCREPNMQQLNKKAKGLIIPRDGHAFLSIDYSQVEFRIIVHYIQNRYAIQAYTENPDTDFHTWVAEMVGIPRRPAKSVNFMLGYRGGKRKTLAMLQDQPDLMNEIRGTCDTQDAFRLACKMRANQVYDAYHAMMPELKQVSDQATLVCKTRGYIRNLYGRRRKLPAKAAHKAFNTLCQSSAADLAKERAVALCQYLRAAGGRLLAIVHDEFLLEVPASLLTPDYVADIVKILESPGVPIRVPIRATVSRSATSWASCQ